MEWIHSKSIDLNRDQNHVPMEYIVIWWYRNRIKLRYRILAPRRLLDGSPTVPRRLSDGLLALLDTKWLRQVYRDTGNWDHLQTFEASGMNGKSHPIGIQSNQFHNSQWFPSFQNQTESTRKRFNSTEHSNEYIRTEFNWLRVKTAFQWTLIEYNDTETGSSQGIESYD